MSKMPVKQIPDSKRTNEMFELNLSPISTGGDQNEKNTAGGNGGGDDGKEEEGGDDNNDGGGWRKEN